MSLLPEPDWRALAPALSALDHALGRLAATLQAHPHLRTGLSARLHVVETCATALAAGALLDPHDLLLHDHKLDARAPTHELVTAHRTMFRARQRAASGDPADWLARGGLLRLAGETPGATRAATSLRPSIDELLAFTQSLEAGVAVPAREADVGRAPEIAPDDPASLALGPWQAVRRDVRDWPPALAAVALDAAWRRLDPLPRAPWLAPLTGALHLAVHDRSPLLLPLAHGQRLARRAARERRRPAGDFWSDGLAALHLAVADTQARLTRLTLAAERLQRRAAGKRRHSRLPALATLLLETPLVDLARIARHCAVSERAAQSLIAEVAGLVTEVTGRQRKQAWVMDVA